MARIVEQINAGDEVACDFCNGGEATMGGVLIGSYAICGECAKTLSNPEEVDEVFNPEQTFKQNVLEYRQRVYGSPDCVIEIWTF